jgi:hypothetical protein
MIDATEIPGHTALATPRRRRLFLRDSALAAVAAGVVTACGRRIGAAPAVEASATPAAPPPPSPAQMSASESEQGMFGMVTALIVKPKPTIA